MQLFFMMLFRQTASTSMGLNNLKPALLKTFIYAAFLDYLYWHRVKTKALAVK